MGLRIKIEDPVVDEKDNKMRINSVNIMSKSIPFQLLFLLYLTFSSLPAEAVAFDPLVKAKKIVLIAGPKSHGPKAHEYIKSVRLMKTMLDNSNVEGIATEIHFNGWPEDPLTLEDADLILYISDGRDGPLFDEVPFMTNDRMEVMKRQMDRGCGLSLIHFSTFASDEMGEKVLDWGGVILIGKMIKGKEIGIPQLKPWRVNLYSPMLITPFYPAFNHSN
ncbi:putative large multi-functional protein [Cyclobacterium qasimii M12-11B]|uniref:Putative large multi-functional protein n=1 Tax=Cyclobacterium qasimii M12-11B TaxID=641524 RepID=S7VFT8_9BACT|nr:putative large multi-functional protein [Cyclobacterium qasimii M12-11B]